MSFFRPEAVAALARWREFGIGLAVSGLGLFGAFGASGALRYVAFFALAAGLALAWEGWRRGRLPRDGGGAGVVEVDERQVSYFSARGGGVRSLDALQSVAILTTDGGPLAPDLFWVLVGDDGPPLMIPSDAEGAEALYDALTALPGIDFERIIAATGSTEPAQFVIWARAGSQRRLS